MKKEKLFKVLLQILLNDKIKKQNYSSLKLNRNKVIKIYIIILKSNVIIKSQFVQEQPKTNFKKSTLRKHKIKS